MDALSASRIVYISILRTAGSPSSSFRCFFFWFTNYGEMDNISNTDSLESIVRCCCVITLQFLYRSLVCQSIEFRNCERAQ